ncbi:PAAR domain-containing protein [Proteus sp. fly-1067]|uniref:PAAR domain-containing protein n=1 Tax=Proteus sp. fly-1067 TaxID=3136674 RepID=UPI0032DB59A1
MRSTIQGRKFILKNDTTNTKGTVLSGSLLAKQTHEIACLGDEVYCPDCQQKGRIIEGDAMMKINNIPVALEGHKVQCGCLNGSVLVAIE